MSGKETNILFSGDFAPIGEFELIGLERGEQIFNDALDIIKKADISFVNLECPLTDSSNKIVKAGPNLKAKPDLIKCLKSFTIAGLANNHCMDFGMEGLNQTIRACKDNGILTTGITSDDEITPLYIEKNGLIVSIIAIAEREFNEFQGTKANPFDIIKTFEAVKIAKQNSDIVLLTIHGGNEYFNLPRPGLIQFCRFFIKQGVEAIICHHPHIPGGYEIFEGKPIFYSLGNLIFDNIVKKKFWEYGYLVKFNIKNKSIQNFEIIPYNQTLFKKGVSLLRDDEKASFLNDLEELRLIIEKNDLEYINRWKSFCLDRKTDLYSKLYLPIKPLGSRFYKKGLTYFLRILNNTSNRRRINLLKCDSHREALINLLDSDLDD